MTGFHANRRILAFLAAFFFVTSIYLCTSRLYTMSFTRQDLPGLENNNKDEEITLTPADYPMTYGTQNHPKMDGLTLHANLPEQHVPTLENKKRLIIIGDIHGMLEPLQELLSKLDFNKERDHIISVGDMINKGPDSPGVVSLLMSHGASAVRGNHEDRILLALNEASSSSYDPSPLTASRKGEAEVLATGNSLSEDQVLWLAKLPVILTIEQLRIHVVHAGMVPGVKPLSQDPSAVMNMRTLAFPRQELRKKEKENRKRSDGSKKDHDDDDDDDNDNDKKKKEHKNKNHAEDSEHKVEGSKDLKDKDKEPKDRKYLDENSAESKHQDKDSKDSKASKHRDEDSRPQSSAAIESESEPPSDEEGDEGLLTEEQILQQDDFTDLYPAVPLDSRQGEAWTKVWNRFQRRLKRENRWTIVYGHDAKRGFMIGRYSFGLDSACVKGGALTALIIEGAEGGGWTQTHLQVQCKKSASEKSK